MNSPKDGGFSVFKQDAKATPFYCRWTEEEDKLLFEAVEIHGPHKWSLIARHIPGRTPVQCSTRWLGALNPHVHKGRWSPQEDEALTMAVQSFGDEYTQDNLPWSRIAQNIPNRTGIQCQARWTEALDPSVRKGRWKKEEDDLLQVGVERYGCCWIRVASSIPGRTQRQCRTRWNQIQSKMAKLRQKQLLLQQSDKKKRKRKTTTTTKKKQLIEPSSFAYQEAIVIPSDIASPLQSPITASSVSTEEDDILFDDDLEFEEERRDYFTQRQQHQQQQEQHGDPFMSLFSTTTTRTDFLQFSLDNLLLDSMLQSSSITLSV